MSSNGMSRNPDATRYRRQMGYRPSVVNRQWLLEQMIETGRSSQDIVDGLVTAARLADASRSAGGPTHSCRQMPTRNCPAAYGAVCGDRPCARFESDDETPWLSELNAGKTL